MAFLVLSGPYLNHLTRLLSAPTPSPVADTAFPIGGLYDNRANTPFRFSAIAADSTVSVDLCAVSDPSFETGVSAWTAVSGTMTQSNTQKNSGTYSAKFAAAGSSYYSFTARAGEQRQITAALYGGGAGVAAIVRVYCVETGHYLQAGGASWAAASSDLFSRTTASWATSTQAYTVEPSSTTFSDTVTLRIYVVQTGAGTTYRDDIEDYPGVTWGSVHGHNLSAAVTPKWQSSPDNAAWTDRITPTLRRDSFYGTVAVTYLRYWRLLLSGTPGTIPWMGEMVLGQHYALGVNPLYPGGLELMDRQVRLDGGDGSQWAYMRGGGPQRRLTMSYAYRNDTDYLQAKDILFRGSRGGGNVCVIAPVEMDSAVVILGRIGESAAFGKVDYWSRTGEFELTEEPLPQMG